MEIAISVLKKLWLLLCILTLLQVWDLGSCEFVEVNDDPDFYSYSVLDISGQNVSLEKYRGQVSLVVNVASQRGYTHGHYGALVLLQDHFVPTKKFNVLAFPCNQFGHQEPGTNKDILDFVTQKMRANFPLFSKINVQEPDISPAWSYLINYSGRAPTWNFWKYLVDHNGHVLNAWGPSTSPDQLYPNIQAAIDSIDKDKDDTRREEF